MSSKPFRARRIIRSSEGQSIFGTVYTLIQLPDASEAFDPVLPSADVASQPQASSQDLLMIRLHLSIVGL